MSFEAWMAKADRIVERRIGLSAFDLEDWNWYDAFEDGFTPSQAVSEFLADVGADF